MTRPYAVALLPYSRGFRVNGRESLHEALKEASGSAVFDAAFPGLTRAFRDPTYPDCDGSPHQTRMLADTLHTMLAGARWTNSGLNTGPFWTLPTREDRLWPSTSGPATRS